MNFGFSFKTSRPLWMCPASWAWYQLPWASLTPWARLLWTNSPGRQRSHSSRRGSGSTLSTPVTTQILLNETNDSRNQFPPGYIITKLWHKQGHKDSDIEQRAQRTVPIGRCGTSEEVAKSIAFLASPDSSYIVGHTLVVDGGISLTTKS